jgi:hypothetical protein
MTGMWRFFGNKLHFTGPERVLFFSFLEVVVVTCAARARQHIREAAERAREAQAAGLPSGPVTAGADGVAIWIVSIMSGVFSALDARSGAEAVFRLMPPVLAAWLWDRGLIAERRSAGKESYWHILTGRLLIRLGLTEPDRHTATEAAARWRLMRLARVTVRAKRSRLFTGFWTWRARSRIAIANERAGLATDPGRQQLLQDYIATLLGAEQLIAIEPPPPWAPPSDGQSDDQSDEQSDGDGPDRQGDRQDRRRPDRDRRRDRRQIDPQKAAKVRKILADDWNTPIAEIVARTGVSESTVTRIKRKMPTPLHVAPPPSGDGTESRRDEAATQ